MIKVTRKLSPQTTHVTEFPDEKLPELCLHYCGGGYSVSQTTKALILQNKILTTGKGKVKNVVITKE